MTDTRNNLGAREYVQAGLDLANWRTGDDPQALLHAYGLLVFAKEGAGRDLQRLAGKFTNFTSEVVMAPPMLEKIGLLRKRLEDFIAAGKKDRARFRAIADSALEEVAVDTTLQLNEDGELEYVHSFHPGHRDGQEGLLLAFLLSRSDPFGDELRKCLHCSRFFLAVKNPRGGPRPKYCPGTDHQQLHDNKMANARRKKYAPAKAKHK
ncbi:MAG: hypothetical protein ABI859_16550 [Pseudomonadota bacterium]